MPDGLEQALRLYLELQIREAQDRAVAAEAAKRKDEVRADVGRMVLFLFLLVGYGLVLGVASRTQVVSALLDPETLAHDVQMVAAGGSAAVAAVPGALQGVLIAAITTFALLMFRGTSTSVRSDAGGVVFVGGAILSLVGISAAAFTGTFGLLMALPGLVAAVVLVGELCLMLIRLHAETAERPEQVERPAHWSNLHLGLWSRRLSPVRHRAAASVFIALPALCLLAFGGAVLMGGGPLYVPAYASRFVMLGWCLWAIAVTPAAARIPVWSSLVWGALVVVQLSSYPASLLFVLAVAVLLYVDVVWLVLAADRQPIVGKP